MGVVSKLIEADKEDLKERVFHNYAGKIKTYRLVHNEMKRVVEEWGSLNSDEDN